MLRLFTCRDKTIQHLPTLCEINSSWSTEEFDSIWIQSMAIVGTSDWNTRLMLLATLHNKTYEYNSSSI